ncbi:MAG: PKD domain-containing protein, partial [Bacteroidota bacterium]
MKKLFLSLLLLLGMTQLWAQTPLTVSGQVTTDGTTPEVGYLLHIEYYNYGGQNSFDSAFTDSSGFYAQQYFPTNNQGGEVNIWWFDCQGNYHNDSLVFSAGDSVLNLDIQTCPNGLTCQASFFFFYLSNTSFQFNSTSSGSTPMGPITHSWDFGDTNTSTEVNPAHTYNAPGTYTVTLIIDDSLGGCSDTAVNTITVLQTSCLANFSWTPNGSTIDFTNLSTTTPGAQYQWYFGDGNSSVQENPSHTYAADSVYEVMLIVNDSSCTDTAVQYIPVLGNLLCAPYFTYSSLGLDVNFVSIADSLGCTGHSYTWDFGDGVSSNVSAPFHSYSTPGFYNVCLTLTDTSSGNTNTWCDSIHVDTVAGPCSVFFSYFPDSFNTNTINFYP